MSVSHCYSSIHRKKERKKREREREGEGGRKEEREKVISSSHLLNDSLIHLIKINKRANKNIHIFTF